MAFLVEAEKRDRHIESRYQMSSLFGKRKGRSAGPASADGTGVLHQDAKKGVLKMSSGPQDAEKTPLLELKDVCFGYEDDLILDHLSLQVDPGDFIGVVGSNGAGKSTLIKVMLGLLPPDRGEVLWGGRPQRERAIRVGYVSQKSNAFNSGFPATVGEIVLSNLYQDIGLFRRPGAKHREKVREALRMVDLEGFEKRPISELSGGQQQRVFIARTLVMGARLIFLDEPTSGVDARTEGEIYHLLSTLNSRYDIGIVLVSHDMNAVTVHANRMFCLGADGFFEHCMDEGCGENFYRRLYGFEVVPHIHHHADDDADQDRSEARRRQEHCHVHDVCHHGTDTKGKEGPHA